MTDDKQNNPQHHGMNVSGLRRSATGFVLDRDDLADDPVVQFEDWFRYACDTVPMDPNAMSISTVDDQNRPSSRTVLLKYFDEAGFVFFTNFESKKAMQIEDNPNVFAVKLSVFPQQKPSNTSCPAHAAVRLVRGFRHKAA
jgi:pyridoxine/pyridoxamine 5'-phosphate oxidase